MSLEPYRLPNGGRIDRTRVNLISFDRRELPAHPGDTLASALLASGITPLARSFKYHRPRGLMTAGPEEPNALVELRTGDRREPNTPATMIEAYDGLQASSQNAWPSINFDIGATNQLLAPMLSAGFYYKTFMGPVVGPLKGTRFWMFCEHFIRRAAGLGRAAMRADPDSYEKAVAHCDVLIVGAGPAGLAAASSAARGGADVILVEQDFELGGSLLGEPSSGAAESWRTRVVEDLESLPNVRILRRTTAFGAYDGNVFGLIERCWDHVAAPPPDQPRQCYWQVRANKVIYATGALERPLVFAGNDRPGVMLAGALRQYINRYAVLPGRDIIIATNNDSAYLTAVAAKVAGARVTLLDTRAEVPDVVSAGAIGAGVDVRRRSAVLSTQGAAGDMWRTLATVRVGEIDASGYIRHDTETLPCTTLAMSGGWSPVIHLWSHPGRKPVYDREKDCFLAPDPSFPGGLLCGGAAGIMMLENAIRDGARAGRHGPDQIGRQLADTGTTTPPPPSITSLDPMREIAKTRIILAQDGKPTGKAFVDFQHDVTLADIDQAYQEGYVSVEHLKRYTTTGMATDQGKTSNINALARMAEKRGIGIEDVGTTTFRPPYTPVSIGALASHHGGPHLTPTRITPIHGWHTEHGAMFTDAGAWKRPRYYPRPGEDIDAAYRREANHVREHVGIVDVSTLGKIAVQGPDSAEFLNRVYVNGWKTLPVGRLRYGVMLRDDGFVLDDGATARLGENDYLMSTTTTNAGPVLAHLEYLLQSAWTGLRVSVTSVTDQWAVIAVAGPQSRTLLSSVINDTDLSNSALPNNHFVESRISDVDIRIHRMSYSGELAYEVYCGSGHGRFVWEKLYEAGQPLRTIAYGTEAMGTLRVEKGHVAGPELDGRTTLRDLGLEGFASTRKPFVGAVLRSRPALVEPGRPTLVGLAITGDKGARPGMLLFSAMGTTEGHGEGHVTSTTYSPALGHHIALALLARGKERQGETVRCVDFLDDLTLHATVMSHHFFDPDGSRQNG